MNLNGLMLVVTLIVLMLLMPSTLVGWGPEGHEIVANLAQTRLSKAAKVEIRSLIGAASCTAHGTAA